MADYNKLINELSLDEEKLHDRLAKAMTFTVDTREAEKNIKKISDHFDKLLEQGKKAESLFDLDDIGMFDKMEKNATIAIRSIIARVTELQKELKNAEKQRYSISLTSPDGRKERDKLEKDISARKALIDSYQSYVDKMQSTKSQIPFVQMGLTQKTNEKLATMQDKEDRKLEKKGMLPVSEEQQQVQPIEIQTNAEEVGKEIQEEIVEPIQELANNNESVNIQTNADEVKNEIQENVQEPVEELTKEDKSVVVTIDTENVKEEATSTEEKVDSLKNSIEQIKESNKQSASNMLGVAIENADTSWIREAKMDTEELRETLKGLYEDKKSMESGKPLDMFSEDEIKEYAQILASIKRIQEQIYGGKDASSPATKKQPPLPPIPPKPQPQPTPKPQPKPQPNPNPKPPINPNPNPNPKPPKPPINPNPNPNPKPPINPNPNPPKPPIQPPKPPINPNKPPITPPPNTIQSYRELEEVIKSIRREYDSLASAVKNQNLGGAAYTDSIQKLKQYESVLKKLEATQKLFTTQREQPEPIQTSPQSYEEVVAYIDTLKSHIESLSQSMQNGTSMDFEKDKKTLAEYMAELKRLEGIKKNIDNGATLSAEAQEQPKAMGLLGLLKETISTKAQLAREKIALPFSNDVEASQARINAYGNSLKNLNKIWGSMQSSPLVSAFNAVKNGASATFKNVVQLSKTGLVALKNGISTVLSSVVNLARGGFNLLKNSIATVTNTMQKLVSGGFNLVKGGIKTVKSGFTSLQKSMHNIAKKTTPNILKSFTSIKSMLMRRIKRTFISSIFNQAKEGLQSLAKSSKDFNQSMSNIKNSAKQASGNLAIVLGNLVQTVEPALQTLLGWFNSVMEAVNGLFAMLTGKKTMLVAKKGTDDYAKSLKNASGSAKDLNKQLYGFDEITRQEDNNSGNSGSGKTQYEEQEIGDVIGGINDFFAEMLQAFQNGEFEKLGSLISDQLNNVVSSIDGFVNGLRSSAKEWSSNIARILNGMVESFDFENLGNLLGHGLDLAFETVNTFLTTFDFKAFGENFADIFTGLVDSVEWSTIGETIANWFNALPQFLSGLFDKIPWADLGKSFAESIQSLFDNIDWDARKEAISKGINGITDMLTNLVSNVKWTDIAKDFGTHLNDTINAIEWGKIANLVSVGIDAILDSFKALIDSHFFVNLATNLGDMFGQILNKINWGKVASDIVLGLAELRTAFWSFIEKLNLPSLATSLAKGINSLLDNDEVKEAWNTSHEKAKDGLKSIQDAFHNFVTNINFEGIMGELGTKVGDLFNAVDFPKLATDVKIGLRKITLGFRSFIGNIGLSDIAKKLADGINEFFNPNSEPNLESIAERAGEGVQEIIDAFSDFLATIDLEFISKSISGAINGFFAETDFTKVIGRISDFVLKIGTELGNIVTTLLAPDENGKTLGARIADVFNSMFADENGVAKTDMFSGLSSSLSTALKAILENASDLLTGIDTKSIADDISAFLSGIDWAGILTAVFQTASTFIETALNAAGDILAGLIQWLKTVNWLEVATAIISGIGDMLWSAIKGIGGFLGKILEAIFGETKKEDVEVYTEPVKEALKDAMGDAGVEISEYLSDKISGQIITYNGDENNVDLSRLNNNLLASASMIALGFQDELTEKFADFKNKDEVLEYYSTFTKQLLESTRPETADVDMIGRLFWEAGVSVTEDFAKALIGIGDENVAMALSLFVQGVDQNTVQALASSNLNNNLTNFVNETGVSIDQIAKALMGESQEDLRAIASALGIEIGGDLGSTVPEALKKALEEGKGWVKKAADDVASQADTSTNKEEMGKNAKESSQEVVDKISETEEAGKDKVGDATDTITKTIDDKIKELPENEQENAKKMMDMLLAGILEGDPAVQTAIEESAKAVVAKAEEILSSTKGLEIATAFLDGIKNGITNYATGADGIDGAVETKASGAYDKASTMLSETNGETIGHDFIEGIDSGIKTTEVDVVDTIGTIANSAHDNTSDKLSKANGETIGKAFISGVDSGIKTSDVNVVTDATTIAQSAHDNVSNILNKDNGETIGKAFIGGVEDGVTSPNYDVAGKVEDIVRDARDYADSYMSYNNGYTIGQNMIAGLYNGFESYSQDLVDFIAYVCNISAETAREILGIHSPSRVFAEIGSYTMQGMQIGLEQTGANAIDAVAEVANAMINEAQDNPVELGITSMTDGLDEVTSKFMKLADIMSGIADTIASMGGLEIPTVASGKVLPYRTKVDTSESTTENVLNRDTLGDALYDAITRAMGNMNNEQNVRVYLDGKEITNAVNKYQRQQQRAWGV